MKAFAMRLALAAAAGVVALLVLIVTFWFLGEALLLWLESENLRPASAAALTGVAGLVVVGLLGLAAKLAMRSPRPRKTAVAAAANAAPRGLAADLGMLAAEHVIARTRAHPYKTLGASLAAGLVLGAVPELRRIVTSLLHR